MLTRLDRIQVASSDPAAVQGAFERLLDARQVRNDRVEALGASRVVLQLGTSEIEILAPEGTGAIAAHIEKNGAGLFAPGVAVGDMASLKAQLEKEGVAYVEEGEQLFITPEALGIAALPVVVSPVKSLQPVGLVDFIYEVTHMCDDFSAAMKRFARAFAVPEETFHPISSAQFGYDGTLTLFNPGQLDRLEMITPNKPETTMGRFFSKMGDSLYMCYSECADTSKVMARLEEFAPRDWSTTDPAGRKKGAPNNLFIHPKALGGMMMGISAREVAWIWSGDPERAKKAATNEA